MRDTVLIGLLAPVFAAAASLRRRNTRRRTEIDTEIATLIGISCTAVHHGRTTAPALGTRRAGATERAA